HFFRLQPQKPVVAIRRFARNIATVPLLATNRKGRPATMNSQTALGISGRLVLAGLLVYAVAARADDADEISKMGKMADQEMRSSDSSGPKLAPASAHDKDIEIRRLQEENARLRRELVDQESRHQAEMQRSYYNMGCVYKASHQYERAETEFLKVLA